MLLGEFTPGMALGSATSASQVMAPNKQHTFLENLVRTTPQTLVSPTNDSR